MRKLVSKLGGDLAAAYGRLQLDRRVRRLGEQALLLDELRTAALGVEHELSDLEKVRADLIRQKLALELKSSLDSRWRESP